MMQLLGHIIFALRCGFYSISLLVYGIHATLQFITKPGSRILVFGALHLILFAGRFAIHPWLTPLFDEASTAIGFDLLSIPFAIDIALFVASAPLWWLYGLAAENLRPIVGALPTPAYPLPPRRKLVVASTELATEKARIVIRSAGRTSDDALEAAYAALPEELKQLMRTDQPVRAN